MKFVATLRTTLALGTMLALSVAFSQPQNQPAKPTGTRLVTRQLVWPLDANFGFLNGTKVQFQYSSRTLEGRSVLPLRELSRVIAIPLESVPSVTDGIRFGKLELYPSLRLARLDGKQVALSDVATMLDGTLYIVTRNLSVAINADVEFDAIQRLITLTIARDKGTDSSLPVARFATDKREYKLGEPVKIIEYSYDPNGVPITFEKYSGREDAYFTPGSKSIGLQVTNKNGLVSEVFTQQIRVTPEVMYGAREYGLRFAPLGRTIPDKDVLSYAMPQFGRTDESIPLLLSDSPEEPNRSGLLYEDVVNGPARLIAYHTNGAAQLGRVLIFATNLETTPVQVRVNRFGETSATTVVATLGRVSLLDFLTSSGRESLNLDTGKSASLYLSQPLDPGEGLNLMFDLETTGRVQLAAYFVEEALIQPTLNDLGGSLMLQTLQSLPVLDRDGVHQRGTFYGAMRRIQIDLNQLPAGTATRLVIGDGQSDPFVIGQDVLTGESVTLKGNYGITYRISLENAHGTVGALVPRGGPYAGALQVNGVYTAVPDSGMLYRNDLPALIYRALEGNLNHVDLELVPASGSYLPINLLFYRVAGLPVTLR